MTLQQVKTYITTQLTPPVNQAIRVVNALFAVLDFTTTQISEIIPDWTNALVFNTDGSGAGRYCKHADTTGRKRIFETKTDANVNNAPPTNPLITETTHWREISSSAASGISEWAAGLFGPGLVIVYHTHSVDGAGLYRLLEPTRPYNSTNIETEITANKWERIGGSGSGKGIAKTYEDIAALLADQAAQHTDFFYLVTDASADATVDAGWAVYQKLAATTAAIGDYRKLAEAESLDVIIAGIPDASETVAGKVEEATDSETQAGTATGSTGAKLFVSAAKLSSWWTWVKTQTQTFDAKISFTSATRFNSVTGSSTPFLKVDSNNDLTAVAAASQADMIAGTDNTKPATAKSVEDKRTIKTVSISPSSGTLTLDCGGKQECKFLCDTISGALTIALTNATALEVLHLIIPMTGSSIPLTFPSETRMSRYNETSSGDGWNQGSKILTVSSTGTADLHEFSLVKAGSVFKLNHDGPARA